MQPLDFILCEVRNGKVTFFERKDIDFNEYKNVTKNNVMAVGFKLLILSNLIERYENLNDKAQEFNKQAVIEFKAELDILTKFVKDNTDEQINAIERQ